MKASRPQNKADRGFERDQEAIMPDLPIACTLRPAAFRARREGFSELLRRAQDREEMSNGYRLRFPATEGMLRGIARTVDAERQCCRYLRFSITVEADGGAIVLELTDPPGTCEFVSELFEG